MPSGLGHHEKGEPWSDDQSGTDYINLTSGCENDIFYRDILSGVYKGDEK